MASIASLWRYPIKAHGREEVETCTLTAGQTMPGDRLWAVAHQKSQANENEWARCGQFTRACNSPTLMAIESNCGADGTITVHHSNQHSLTFDPETQGAEFIAWLATLMEGDKFEPTRLIKAAAGHGMTDAHFPSITLCNHASHRAIEGRAGLDLSIHRWRGNIWMEGMAPWEEFDLIGKEVALGGAHLRVIEPTTRCAATAANPKTGLRDVNLLSVLDAFGHQDFSVQTEVIKSGPIRVGDRLEVL